MQLKPRRKPRLRKVYLLPNLFTAFNLFLGIYALMAAYEGDLRRACWAMFLAGLLDGLDGLVARLTHTQSIFGQEFDSLSDAVSFGVAPALAMFALMRYIGTVSPRIAIGVCSLYAICGALRLARYNIQVHGEERKGFLGLPIPAGGAVLIFSILVILEYQTELQGLAIPVGGGYSIEMMHIIGVALPVVVLGTAILMVSEVPYPSILSKIRLRRRMPFDSLVSIICVGLLILALQSDLRILLLFCMPFIYIFYGLGIYGYRRIVRKERPTEEKMVSPAEPGPSKS